MKKLENFSWKMWHIFSLVAVTVLLVGGIWSFFYLKEAAYVVNDRNYDYVGRGQRLTDYVTVDEEETGFPIIALSFKMDDEDWNISDYAVGRQYLAFQDSKLRKISLNKKDPEEYFKIRYYQLGKEEGEGKTIDVLKIAQGKGYKTINGSMDSIMYTDGKDDYVGVNLSDNDYLFINLRTQKVSQTRPKEAVHYGYSGIRQIASSLYYRTPTFYEDEEKTSINLPWIRYKKEKVSETSDSSITSSTSEKKDSELLSLLKKYGFLIVLKEDMTFSDGESIIRHLYADASDFFWSVKPAYTKSGKMEYVHTDDDLQKVVDEKKVKKHEDE
ncbi:hypothetical protein [Streptococcus parasanguinis]|uniref:hypothetical protein n=1 Tax=Streptococcus parasanguinis TaxID=1318 RepID=UPI0034A50978